MDAGVYRSSLLQMYFNATLTESAKLLKPLLVFSFIMGGIICGLTRIIQFKNHAIDVYCGFLIGGGIAVYLVRCSSRSLVELQMPYLNLIMLLLQEFT